MAGPFEELISFVGPAGVPVSLAAATYALAAWLEDGMSKEGKQTLTNHLRVVALPPPERIVEGPENLLTHIFGARHFSLRCALRSAIFSVCAAVLMMALYAWSRWTLAMGSALSTSWPTYMYWTIFSVIPDYFNLYKTRIVIRILRRANLRNRVMLLIAALDFLFGSFLFYVLFMPVMIVGALTYAYFAIEIGTRGLLYMLSRTHIVGEGAFEPSHVWSEMVGYISFDSFNAALFYAGMLPSVWLWLFILSLISVRLITKAAPFASLLWGGLDIQDKPLRSIGRVAAIVMFFLAIFARVVI